MGIRRHLLFLVNPCLSYNSKYIRLQISSTKISEAYGMGCLRAFALTHVLLSVYFSCAIAAPMMEAPPSTVTLLVPPTSNITLGSFVEVGLHFADSPSYDGLFEGVGIYVIYPDGTSDNIGESSTYWQTVNLSQPLLQSCITNGEPFGISAAGFTANQLGTLVLFWFQSGHGSSYLISLRRYTLQYNVSYWLSSDPSQANATYCGPKPFLQQTWLLNYTFDVSQNGDNVGSIPLETLSSVVATLPSSPTGEVLLNAAGLRYHFGGTLLGLMAWLLVVVVVE